MRISQTSPAIKHYLIRVYEQFKAGKLTPNEETLLMQDLYDSNFYLDMGPEVKILIDNLLRKKVLVPKQTGN